MRKNNRYVVYGAAALCVGLVGAGCHSNEVMQHREYIPVEEAYVDPMPYTGETVYAVTPLPYDTPTYRPSEVPNSTTTATYIPSINTNLQNEYYFEPMPESYSEPVYSPEKSGGSVASASAGDTVHVIKKGDTVGHLAKRYGVSIAAIMQANNLDEAKARRLQINQKLIIPQASGAVVAASGRSTGSAGRSVTSTASGTLNNDGTYTVGRGDMISTIAKKVGVKQDELMRANNLDLESAKRLQIGQKLIVPGKSGSAPASTSNYIPVRPVNTTPVSTGVTTAPSNGDSLQNILMETRIETTTTATDTTVLPISVIPDATPAGDLLSDDDFLLLDTTASQIPEDTTVEDFARLNGTTVERLRQINTDIPADGQLKKGRIIFLPKN